MIFVKYPQKHLLCLCGYFKIELVFARFFGLFVKSPQKHLLCLCGYFKIEQVFVNFF